MQYTYHYICLATWPLLLLKWPQSCCTDHAEIWHGGPTCQIHIDRPKGVGLRPLNVENLEFYGYNCHMWWISCAIISKLSWFMHVLRLQIYRCKFGCFSTTDNKAKHRWGNFPKNFRWLLAAKLLSLMESWEVRECNDGSIAPSLIEIERRMHVDVRRQSLMFFSLLFLCLFVTIRRLPVSVTQMSYFHKRQCRHFRPI